MTLRKSLFIVGLVLILLPLSCWAQETPKAEVFAGYSYVRVNPEGSPSVNMNGFDFSVAGNVNQWFGLVADLGYYRSHGYAPSVDAFSYLFGPRFSYRKNEKVTPFFQTLFGGVDAGPNGQKENNFAMTVGGGVDINVHRNIALRPFQLEYLMIRSSGMTLNNLRFATGVVFRFGFNRVPVVPKHPTATCAVDSSPIMQGKTANVSAVVSDFDLGTVAYSWTTSGGKVTGSGSTVVFDSAGADPGTYTVTGKVSDKAGSQATCSANVVVEAVPVPPKPNRNPTVSCSVDRASLMEGESTRAYATASDPDGDPLTYEWTTSAGRLTGTGANVTFNSAGVPAGTTVTVGAMVSDGRGGTASCSSTVQVNALPPKPKPQPISCLSAGFPHNLARINNVDKACLDDVSLKMQNDPHSTLTITGYADASEAAAKALAKKRAESAKDYLVKGQKLDPGRINAQSAAPLKGKGVDEQKGNRRVEIMFYPEGTQPK
jgi:outer membrane protein OmpA-like peptidoglycan-associated protein